MRDDRSVTALVEAAHNGDKAAWDEIVHRYAPLVWSVCRRHRLTDADCEDVAQNVWMQLIRHLSTLREPAALPGWLATTTARECLRTIRAAAAANRLTPDAAIADRTSLPDTDAASIEDLVIQEQRRAALLVALDLLPEDCRRLLRLLIQDPPLPYAEIADRLGVPVGTLGPRRGRCLARLRRSPVLARLLD
jgi:RNA polymerase sigma factor (sigma-70 family)